MRDIMKNIIEFYYNLSPEEIEDNGNVCYFNTNDKCYVFKEYNLNVYLIDDITKLNMYLGNYLNLNKIIFNKFNNPITKINDNYFILMLINDDNTLDLAYIINFSAIPCPDIKSLERNDWETLWSSLIDYYEAQVGENCKKYPLIRESFDYFVGMAETATSYLAYTKREVHKNVYDTKVLSHNNLFVSTNDPLNIIIDHKARDLAEYIKLSFFNKNKNIFKELDEYFHYNKYSDYGIRVLFARILYPSFYFKIYNDIIRGTAKEQELNTLISSINDYEDYIYNIYVYLKRYSNIPSVEWLKKRDINSRL